MKWNICGSAQHTSFYEDKYFAICFLFSCEKNCCEKVCGIQKELHSDISELASDCNGFIDHNKIKCTIRNLIIYTVCKRRSRFFRNSNWNYFCIKITGIIRSEHSGPWTDNDSRKVIQYVHNFVVFIWKTVKVNCYCLIFIAK